MGSERDPLRDAHEEIERLRELVRKAHEEIQRLRQAIHGNAEEGIPGLRGRLSDLQNEMEVRLNKMSERLDAAQVDRDRMNWRLSMMSGAIKWLGPTGVITILGFIIYIIRTPPV